MLKQLKMDLKLFEDDFAMPLVIVPFGFLMGFALLSVIMFTTDADTWVPMGTIMGLGMLMLFTIAFFAKYYQEFMLALSMGRTRKAFLFSYAVRSLMWLVLGYGLVLVLQQVELAVGSRLFVEPLAWGPSILTKWWFIATLLPGTVVLSMFIGSLHSYFGKKAMAPLYFLWIGGLLFGSRLSWVWNLLPGAVWAGLGVGAVVAMVITIIVLGKKQMVK